MSRLSFHVQKKLSGIEIVHYADAEQTISSRHHIVFVDREGKRERIKLPTDLLRKTIGLSRLARRVLRLDKCNVVPVGKDLRDLVILRQGQVFHYDHQSKKLTPTLHLNNCRNVLHQSIAVIEGTELFFGEYGHNGKREAVPIYRSIDAGRSWTQVYAFAPGEIKHIHGCFWDPFEKKVWVFTGDFAGECQVLVADREFCNVERLGDGQQEWRACNAFFEPESVYWIMDSQLQPSLLMRLDRKTRTVRGSQRFPGPVWYIKRLQDGVKLAATACEVGPGVEDEFAHLFVSRDLDQWEEVARFRHDGLPKGYFKFGVLGFADGPQTSDSFYMFGEALRGMDGKSVLCRLQPEERA